MSCGASRRSRRSPHGRSSPYPCAHSLLSTPPSATITPVTGSALHAVHLLQRRALPHGCGGLGLILVLRSVTLLLLPRERDPARLLLSYILPARGGPGPVSLS